MMLRTTSLDKEAGSKDPAAMSILYYNILCVRDAKVDNTQLPISYRHLSKTTAGRVLQNGSVLDD